MKPNIQAKLHFLDLYCMVIADGIVHPKELETLYRIGIETYGLTEEEINKSIVTAGKTMTIPKSTEERVRLLYEMALIAWADGEVDESERNMLQRYAIRYGIKEENAKEFVDFLLAKAEEGESEDNVINSLNN